MEVVKSNVVSIWPQKKKRFELGYLAEELKKSFEGHATTLQGKFLQKEKERLLRRLFHTIHGKAGFTQSFPISIDQITNRTGVCSIRIGNCRIGSDRPNINIFDGYKKIALALRKEGLILRVTKKSCNWEDSSAYKTQLSIWGWKK